MAVGRVVVVVELVVVVVDASVVVVAVAGSVVVVDAGVVVVEVGVVVLAVVLDAVVVEGAPDVVVDRKDEPVVAVGPTPGEVLVDESALGADTPTTSSPRRVVSIWVVVGISVPPSVGAVVESSLAAVPALGRFTPKTSSATAGELFVHQLTPRKVSPTRPVPMRTTITPEIKRPMTPSWGDERPSPGADSASLRATSEASSCGLSGLLWGCLDRAGLSCLPAPVETYDSRTTESTT
ncbi:MAG TPA: hypothetical protein VE569_12610 [Acidimicrobiia bacterium]|nr:hypothetical protein [Acidimicrobiia bacterium]